MEMFDATADPETLTRRADEMLAAQRPGAARALLAAAQRLAPRAPRMASLAARLEMREGHPAASLTALGQAIAVAPRADLFMLRADARRQLGDVAGAVADAADAVIHDRHNPAAKALLGVLMLELGRHEDAVRCLAEAVDAAPANPGFREGLATALTAAGQPEAAAATYAAGDRSGARQSRVAQCRDPARPAAARFRRRRRAGRRGPRGRAGRCLHLRAEGARAVQPRAACGRRRRLCRRAEAGTGRPVLQGMVAAADVQPDATRASVEYVRNVFDGYADRFETHLISLGYRIPGVMRNAVRTHLPIDIAAGSQRRSQGSAAQAGEVQAGPVGPVLDLGCGTGLVAVVLADLPLGPFVGVDLSPRMLERAAAKHLYAGLHESDIIDFLTDDPRRWGLMLAADVLCYLGALEPLFDAAYARLLPGALFICSAEELVGPSIGNGDWAHGRRFAHSRDYVARTAHQAGFAVRAIEAEVVRHDAGAPVPGFLIVLERPHAVG